MSAAKLAEIIAAHQTETRYGLGDWTPECACGWSAPSEDYRARAVLANAAHVAAVVEAADDLAVIELPKPDEETDRHIAYGDFRRQGGWPATLDRRTGTVYFEDTDSGDSRNLRAATAIRYATNILAAAKAAEGVDRG